MDTYRMAVILRITKKKIVDGPRSIARGKRFNRISIVHVVRHRRKKYPIS